MAPFYITKSGKNLITKNHISQFYESNPKLAEFKSQNNLELRKLNLTSFESLSFWIISQQISGVAANKLIEKFKNEINPLTPSSLFKHPKSRLREIGLSKNKSNYIHNLAEFMMNNEMPHEEKLNSKELIEFYTQIKGIGEWTVQMHLIFTRGKLDILAAKDLVVRKGVQKMYKLKSIPVEKEVPNICRKWGDLSTIGTILAWSIMGE